MNSNLVRKLIISLFLFLQVFTYALASGVIINGQLLSKNELTVLEHNIGTRILPGNYLSDGDCWVNLTNGQSGCLSNTVGSYGANDTDIYNSRYGSGETNSQQDWSHWSDAAGGSVGGTGDGCVYTSFGWSNC